MLAPETFHETHVNAGQKRNIKGKSLHQVSENDRSDFGLGGCSCNIHVKTIFHGHFPV